MVDFTRTLENWAESNGLEYHYGQRSNLNLLTDLNEAKIYVLHNNNRRKILFDNNTGFKTGASFVGDFFVLTKSDFDLPYYKEVSDITGENKYEKHIEPKLKLIEQDLSKALMCEGFTVTQLEIIDITDLLDENADGILVSYAVTISI